MARLKFLARAAAVADIKTLTVGGTIEATDEFHLTVGDSTSGKTLTVVAGSTSAATVADNIVAAWEALSSDEWPEFTEITAEATSGGSFTLTHDTPGWYFDLTISTTESGGGAADAQTFGQTQTQEPTGPDWWDNPDNWDTGAIPVNGDTVDVDFIQTPIRFGLDQSAVTLLEMNVTARFEGQDAYIGLDDDNPNGYPEYRVKDLRIGVTTLNVGYGAGDGSGMIRVDRGTITGHVNAYSTGSRRDQRYPSLRLLGTDSGNTITHYGGDTGIATLIGDDSTVDAPVVHGGTLFVGRGATVTGELFMLGGDVVMDANPASVLKRGGNLTLRGSGNLSTVDVKSGDVAYQGSGNVTGQITLAPGARFSVDGVEDAVTVATLQMHAGSVWVDSKLRAAVTTWDLYQCSLNEVSIILPKHVRITASAL